MWMTEALSVESFLELGLWVYDGIQPAFDWV